MPDERTVDCPTCHGASTVDPDPDCPTCHGEGEVRATGALTLGAGESFSAAPTSPTPSAANTEPPLCEKCGERHYHRTQPFSAATTERDYTAEIISGIAPGYVTRKDAALDYGWGIRYHQDEIDWPKVNAAIIERWSVSGLAWIKREAWRLNEQIAAKVGA